MALTDARAVEIVRQFHQMNLDGIKPTLGPIDLSKPIKLEGVKDDGPIILSDGSILEVGKHYGYAANHPGTVADRPHKMRFYSIDGSYVLFQRCLGDNFYLMSPGGEWRECDGYQRLEDGEAEQISEKKGRTMIAELGGKFDDIPPTSPELAAYHAAEAAKAGKSG